MTIRIIKKYNLFCLFFCFLLPQGALASWSVWTEPLLIDKPQPAYNPASKPTSITVKGARNEWVSFLVVFGEMKTCQTLSRLCRSL